MSDMTRNKVLIVDDEPAIRMAIRRFLTTAGFEVFDADNRVSALTQARKERPDAIILDYKLRDCTALDLLPQFKAIDAAVAVIVLTAHAQRRARGQRDQRRRGAVSDEAGRAADAAGHPQPHARYAAQPAGRSGRPQERIARRARSVQRHQRRRSSQLESDVEQESSPPTGRS